MAFIAKFYNCSDDPRKLSKTLTDEVEKRDVKPTENCDILKPVLELSYDPKLINKNYVVINTPFNRSYFITDMSVTIGKKIIITCAVDVLQTYKDSIKKIKANVVRQEKLIKDMLPDPSFVYLNENDVITKLGELTDNSVFGSNVGQNTIVLGIAGDANSYYVQVPGFTLLTEEPANWPLVMGNYWVNSGGGTTVENMIRIGVLINAGLVSVTDTYNDIVGIYGGVYSKDPV